VVRPSLRCERFRGSPGALGRPLVGMNSRRYQWESDFRFGEKVLVAVREIVDATARLTWITAGYGWISIVGRIVIASPPYFSGRLSFGELMVAVGGFYQVNQSLRWFVDNFALLADWRAALSRVIKFREVLQMSESGCEDAIPMPFGGVKPVNPAALRPFRTSAQTSGSL
jgi:ABC-type multidrug transport system fused ATPase/permease subunit